VLPAEAIKRERSKTSRRRSPDDGCSPYRALGSGRSRRTRWLGACARSVRSVAGYSASCSSTPTLWLAFQSRRCQTFWYRVSRCPSFGRC